MGQEYTITNVQRRSEWASKYGRFQDYAITVAGDKNGWIKLTQKPDTAPPAVGSTIFGRIETSTNGTPYRKFKKENPNAPQNPGQLSLSDPKLDYIILMLEELTGRKPRRERAPASLAHDDPFAGLM